LEKGRGILGKQAGSYVNEVIEFVGCEDFKAGTESAAFPVIGGVDEPGDARLDNGAGTHGTGFESDVKSGLGEPVVAKEMRSFADGDNFGVSGGIVISNGAVTSTREYVSILNEDCADGNLASLRGSTCFGESELHEIPIVRHESTRITRHERLLPQWGLVTEVCKGP